MNPVTIRDMGMESETTSQSSQPAKLVLFSRPDCHLCDVAAELLQSENLAFTKKDIETDIELISQYGTRIPVLLRTDSRSELGWPFTSSRLRKFVESGE